MNLLVGLTGGIGSGKTVVSNHFTELGVSVVDTDVVAREVVAFGSPILTKLAEAFGQQIINADGSLNRDALREIAFTNNSNKQMLDNIMHPAIRKKTLEQIQQADSTYCIVVVPLLIETNFKDLVDRILVITANKQNRIDWIKKRSAISAEQIEDIMQSQTTDKERLQFADDILENNNSIESLKTQINTLHQKYLELAEISTRS